MQHGLQVRLQLFKTQNKGWGIRCLDDVAKGSFVCIYAGEEGTLIIIAIIDTNFHRKMAKYNKEDDVKIVNLA